MESDQSVALVFLFSTDFSDLSDFSRSNKDFLVFLKRFSICKDEDSKSGECFLVNIGELADR